MFPHTTHVECVVRISRSNRKLIFNFPRKFVDNEVGYLLGKPVNYVSKSDNDEVIHKIDLNMSHWDKEHNINLRKQSEIYGESYELNYIDSDGQFSAIVLSPLNAYVLEDGTTDRNVLLGLHKFTRRFDEKVYLDVYTDSEILHYQNASDDKAKQTKQITRTQISRQTQSHLQKSTSNLLSS